MSQQVQSRFKVRNCFPVRQTKGEDVLLKVWDDNRNELIKAVVPRERAGDYEWLFKELDSNVWTEKPDITANPNYWDAGFPLRVHESVVHKWKS